MNFDFRIIEKEYPKAFALWVEQEEITRIEDDYFRAYYWKDRDTGEEFCQSIIYEPMLLDFFFDEQGIIGSVIALLTFDAKFENPGTVFDIKIKMVNEINNIGSEEDDDSFLTRSEALAALWLKEFSILESHLEGSEGKEEDGENDGGFGWYTDKGV